MKVFKLFISFLCVYSFVFSDQIVFGKNSQQIRIAIARSVQDIDLKQGQDVLVKSFMDAYESVPLIELNPKFKSTGDVRRFYQDYFKEELEHFSGGHLYWVQAFVGEKLVGFATFELEPNEKDAVYMNLLAVHPDWQGIGVGKYLTFSIRSEELFSNIKKIQLLIRKVNIEGKRFYEKIGFSESDYTRNNFVDPALLTGLSWQE